MRKLLVPFDGSDNAMRALRHAITLCGDDRASSIHLVTAHDEPHIYGEIAVYVTPEKMIDLLRRNGETRLLPAEQALTAAGIPHDKEILVGNIAEVIAQRADALGCDGIVMGTRGMTAIGSLVLGSIATQVVHAAKVPVTLVK